MSYSSAGQRPGLAQDRVGDADLAHVVEQAGHVQRPPQVGVEADAIGQEERVARHVLRMALRVAVLRVDRDDQPLQHVEAGALAGRPVVARALGHVDARRRPTPWLATSATVAWESSSVTASPCGRVVGHAGAEGDGQVLAVRELDVDRLELRAQPLQRGLQVVGTLRRRDGQELIRTEAAQDRGLRELAAQQAPDLQQDRVARRMAMGIVEQPEVVDIDQRQADHARARLARALELGAQHVDDRAVVEQAGQGVLVGRLQQQVGLPIETAGGGAEDQVEQPRQQQRGRRPEPAPRPAARRRSPPAAEWRSGTPRRRPGCARSRQ